MNIETVTADKAREYAREIQTYLEQEDLTNEERDRISAELVDILNNTRKDTLKALAINDWYCRNRTGEEMMINLQEFAEFDKWFSEPFFFWTVVHELQLKRFISSKGFSAHLLQYMIYHFKQGNAFFMRNDRCADELTPKIGPHRIRGKKHHLANSTISRWKRNFFFKGLVEIRLEGEVLHFFPSQKLIDEIRYVREYKWKPAIKFAAIEANNLIVSKEVYKYAREMKRVWLHETTSGKKRKPGEDFIKSRSCSPTNILKGALPGSFSESIITDNENECKSLHPVDEFAYFEEIDTRKITQNTDEQDFRVNFSAQNLAQANLNDCNDMVNNLLDDKSGDQLEANSPNFSNRNKNQLTEQPQLTLKVSVAQKRVGGKKLKRKYYRVAVPNYQAKQLLIAKALMEHEQRESANLEHASLKELNAIIKQAGIHNGNISYEVTPATQLPVTFFTLADQDDGSRLSWLYIKYINLYYSASRMHALCDNLAKRHGLWLPEIEHAVYALEESGYTQEEIFKILSFHASILANLTIEELLKQFVEKREAPYTQSLLNNSIPDIDYINDMFHPETASKSPFYHVETQTEWESITRLFIESFYFSGNENWGEEMKAALKDLPAYKWLEKTLKRRKLFDCFADNFKGSIGRRLRVLGVFSQFLTKVVTELGKIKN